MNTEGDLTRGRKKGSYLYKQVAGRIKEEIESGAYKPDERLMSMDLLAEKYQINKITVCKAMAVLKEEGLVYSQPAKGIFVMGPKQAKLNSVERRLKTIGVVSCVMEPGCTGRHHLELLEAIRLGLGQMDANLLVLPCMNKKTNAETRDLVFNSGLDAAIYVGPFDPMLLRSLINDGPPAVLVDNVVTGLSVDSICLDNRGGGFQAMNYLLEQGHRDLAIVTGPSDQRDSSSQRLGGARDAMEQHGISSDQLIVVEGDYAASGGTAATEKIMAMKKQPSAIFYSNDEMAIAGRDVLIKNGLKIPQDISIIGFDDIALAATASIDLTTIHVPCDEMGAEAVNRVKSLLSSGDQKQRHGIAHLMTRLTLRSSTAAK